MVSSNKALLNAEQDGIGRALTVVEVCPPSHPHSTHESHQRTAATEI
jgi:hypothetical protein